jgi:anthranilate synthase/aminodeoxychorismate synthase-like glutamine amidotransferase
VILVIDNYDSFVDNLARQLRLLGPETRIVRNDQHAADGLLAWQPAAIVISPGPCGPDQAGVCLPLTRAALGRVPLLGICLGHQVLCQALGARIVRARRPLHGQSSLVHHRGESVFAGLPSPLRVGRYHSLIAAAESLPECLQVTATTADGTVMAVHHRQHLAVGLQFHPESILTEHGSALLATFLQAAGIPVQLRRTLEITPEAAIGRESSDELVA